MDYNSIIQRLIDFGNYLKFKSYKPSGKRKPILKIELKNKII
jgi:hypothetical protein